MFLRTIKMKGMNIVKKVLSALVLCILILTNIVIAFAQPEAKGDIDGDGIITARDARLCLRAAIGLENYPGAIKEAADIDSDGMISANDSRLLHRYVVGLESFDWLAHPIDMDDAKSGSDGMLSVEFVGMENGNAIFGVFINSAVGLQAASFKLEGISAFANFSVSDGADALELTKSGISDSVNIVTRIGGDNLYASFFFTEQLKSSYENADRFEVMRLIVPADNANTEYTLRLYLANSFPEKYSATCDEYKVMAHVHGPNDTTETILSPSTCTLRGEKMVVTSCKGCGEVFSETREEIPALGHKDANGDDICDVCNASLSESDHNQDGIQKIIRTLLDFFQIIKTFLMRLFGLL